MAEFVLDRPGKIPITFDGELLAHVSSQQNGIPPGRWQEINIYRTDTGKWVTQIIGRSAYPNEKDRIKIAVCETPDEVREGVSRYHEGRTFITDLGFRALEMAAENDETLVDITRERI